ncbi:HNH endonuclease [Epidermidibacterium keratini]
MKRGGPIPRRTPLVSVTPLRKQSKSRTSREKRRDETKARLLVRMRCFNNNGGLCEICGQREAADPAHRLATGRNGGWHSSNLIAACRPCHDQQRDGKGGEQLATMLGQVLPSRVNGEQPVPACVPVQLVYGRVYLDDAGGFTEAIT